MLPFLRFSPILKRARWGGRRLATVLHKRVGGEPDYSESWEISDLEGNLSVTIDESGKETTLRQLLRDFPEQLLGSGGKGSKQFPLLLKFLDACDRLSLQVHPNDAQAEVMRPGERGKTEAWYILEGAPDAAVYAGLLPGTTLEMLVEALKVGDVEQVLRRIPVKRGDCLLIPAGTVHAIGAGVLLLEVQQASDITYRLHDWGWVDASGKPRELHLSEAFDCIDVEASPMPVGGGESVRMGAISVELLVSCEYFQMRRLCISGKTKIENDSMRIWSAIGGRGEIRAAGRRESIGLGETILIPAATRELEIAGEDLEIIETGLGPG